MIRHFWIEKILELLKTRPIVWVAGVRRVGKTTLCKQITNSVYFDCELPSVRQQLEDPEYFFSKVTNEIIVLDEIHRLVNPSEILKIAADHFPKLKIITTGSSTLSARLKFKDTLTGRKHILWLTPCINKDMNDFDLTSLEDRMIRGGFPEFLLSNKLNDDLYNEWIESYWSKDIQELFTVEKRASFIKFIELLFRQSGELYEAQAFSTPCEVSRPTIQNYLDILETTLLMTVLRPFNDGSATEIKSQVKVYGFDTGFVCYFKGISSLAKEQQGNLLEHLVLNELNARFLKSEIFYWRDKQKHEVDFILKRKRSNDITAIECKRSFSSFDPSGLKAFRKIYPKGKNIIVCLEQDKAHSLRIKNLEIDVIPFKDFDKFLNCQN